MSLLVKSVTCVVLVFLSSLSGTEHVLDVEAEDVSHSGHITSSPHEARIHLNDCGELAWVDLGPHYDIFFYWSKETGKIEISFEEELSYLGYGKRVYKYSGEYSQPYMVRMEELDNYGNVFLRITFRNPTHETGALGVWNKKSGFKLLNIPGLDSVTKAYFSKDFICVTGEKWPQQGFANRLMILHPVDGRWPWELIPEPTKNGKK